MSIDIPSLITAFGGLLLSVAAIITALKTKKENRETNERAERATTHMEQTLQQEKVKTEQARLSIRETLDLYESTVAELRHRIEDLQRSEQSYFRNERERKAQIEQMGEIIAQCEERNAQAEAEVNKLKHKVLALETTNAGLNVEIRQLIKRIEQMLEWEKSREQKRGAGEGFAP